MDDNVSHKLVDVRGRCDGRNEAVINMLVTCACVLVKGEGDKMLVFEDT